VRTSRNIGLWTPSDTGYDPTNLYRNNLARYSLPSVDEWYKAAYYDPTSSVYYNLQLAATVFPPPWPVAPTLAPQCIFRLWMSALRISHAPEV
jgi:hypothetical protein